MNAYAGHIHLDFHTSELMEVGGRFDATNFIKTLKSAHVNSIVVFAKCHHGWCYYPTEIGCMHPRLSFDLMGEQIKACKEAGIRVVVYITGAWSASDVRRHPEWQAVSYRTGRPMRTYRGREYLPEELPGENLLPDCFWDYLCMAGEYGAHMKALTREVLEKYDVDGLFFDIMGLNLPCVCPDCVVAMRREGLDPAREEDVLAYTVKARRALMGELRDIVLSKDARLSVFFNSGGAEINHPEYLEFSTHYEMENLASHSSLGYDGISNRSKFLRETGKPVWGMTGKFHVTWGEFGGFKHPDALLQECAAMVAYGVRCNVGDQLHPDGEINEATYRLVGRAFEYVKSMEHYVEGGETVARLGVMPSLSRVATEGVAKLLMDAHLDYRMLLHDLSNIEKVDCVILSAGLRLNELQENALCLFVERGGRLVLLDRPSGAERLLSLLGYEDLGDSPYDKCYFYSRLANLPDAPVLMDVPTRRFALKGGEELAALYEPYFSRTPAHYSSHRNTPNQRVRSPYPAVAFNDRALCFAQDPAEQYFKYGNYWCRVLFSAALLRVYTPEIQITGLPVAGRYTLYRRPEGKLLHLLYLVPIQRGEVAVLEEPIELCNLSVSMPAEEMGAVRLLPSGEELPATREGGVLHFTVPSVRGFASVLIETK